MSIKLQRNLFNGDYPLSQRFGQNPDWYAKFGMKGHNGIDYAVPEGTALFSAITGTVREVEWDRDGYGKYIKIVNDECGVIYAHMKVLSPLQVGSTVYAGDFLGPSGNTGNSTGPHLHFGVFPKPRDRSNGYAGYIDPLGDQVRWVDNYNEEEQEDEMTCEEELDAMRDSRNKWKLDYTELEGKLDKERQEHAKAIGEKNEQIAQYEKQVAGLQSELMDARKEKTSALAREQLAIEQRDNKQLEADGLKVELEKCQAKIFSQSEKISELKKKAENNLCSFTWWERCLSLVRCKKLNREQI
jgi:septal ring factor EnvC (AmiA/AmiB activator)